MKKIFKNSRGFGAVGIIMALVVIGLIGFAGWYVYQNNKTDVADSNNPTAESNDQKTESTLQEYDDDLASLKYPVGWTVKRDDNESLPGTKELIITSPKADFPLEDSQGEGLKLRLSIFLNSKDSDLGCADCAVLGEIVSLDNPNIDNAKLIFTESSGVTANNDNKADTISVVTGDVKVGDKNYGGLVVKGKNLIVWTDYLLNDGILSGSPNFISIEAIKATQTYKDLITILNSLEIK